MAGRCAVGRRRERHGRASRRGRPGPERAETTRRPEGWQARRSPRSLARQSPSPACRRYSRSYSPRIARKLRRGSRARAPRRGAARGSRPPARWCSAGARWRSSSGPRISTASAALNLRLDLAVHGARRLVEHEHRRVGGDRPREREQLPLADAHRRAALAEHLVEPRRQPRDHAVGADARRRRASRRRRRAAHRQPNVRAHVAGEQEDVLLHVADEPRAARRAAARGCRRRSP